MSLALTAPQRLELEQLLRQTTLAHAIARRARVILALAEQQSYSTIEARFGVTDRFIAIWKRRYVDGGVLALADAPRAGRGHGLSAALEAKIIDVTLHTKPPAPLTHWTTRRLGRKLGVSHNTIAQVWRRANLQPHRIESYMESPDPDFARKAADIIGLYLNPPSTPSSFASMRRPRFKRWIARCRCCRSRLAARNAMGSSTCGMGPCRSTRR
ncbi:MAG: helix-turn-helix domain-containing protein [Gemmatimonadaceae bacterium]